MEFHERLKELRSNAGGTQKEVATDIGVSQQSYADWECGRKNPTQDKLKRIADFFLHQQIS